MPAFYCTPADLYEDILEQLDDQILAKIVEERRNQPLVDIDLARYL